MQAVERRIHIPQKDLRIRAALSHSRSSVAGQKASRCTRLTPRFAVSVLILAKPLGGGGCDALRPKKGPVLLLPEFLFSHEGRKAETRCMAVYIERGFGGAASLGRLGRKRRHRNKR